MWVAQIKPGRSTRRSLPVPAQKLYCRPAMPVRSLRSLHGRGGTERLLWSRDGRHGRELNQVRERAWRDSNRSETFRAAALRAVPGCDSQGSNLRARLLLTSVRRKTGVAGFEPQSLPFARSARSPSAPCFESRAVFTARYRSPENGRGGIRTRDRGVRNPSPYPLGHTPYRGDCRLTGKPLPSDTVGRNSVSHRDTLLAVFARLNG